MKLKACIRCLSSLVAVTPPWALPDWLGMAEADLACSRETLP